MGLTIKAEQLDQLGLVLDQRLDCELCCLGLGLNTNSLQELRWHGQSLTNQQST